MKMKGERDPAYAILYVEGLAPGRFQPLLWCFHLFRLFHSILVFSTPFSAKRLRLKTCTFVRALGCGYLRLQFIREIFLRSGMRALEVWEMAFHASAKGSGCMQNAIEGRIEARYGPVRRHATSQTSGCRF